MNQIITEREMAAALGLTKKAKAIEMTPGLVVELSVRRDGGAPQRFTHQAKTIIRDMAIMEAEQAARRSGLTPWALLDVRSHERAEG